MRLSFIASAITGHGSDLKTCLKSMMLPCLSPSGLRYSYLCGSYPALILVSHIREVSFIQMPATPTHRVRTLTELLEFVARLTNHRPSVMLLLDSCCSLGFATGYILQS